MRRRNRNEIFREVDELMVYRSVVNSMRLEPNLQTRNMILESESERPKMINNN